MHVQVTHLYEVVLPEPDTQEFADLVAQMIADNVEFMNLNALRHDNDYPNSEDLEPAVLRGDLATWLTLRPLREVAKGIVHLEDTEVEDLPDPTA